MAIRSAGSPHRRRPSSARRTWSFHWWSTPWTARGDRAPWRRLGISTSLLGDVARDDRLTGHFVLERGGGPRPQRARTPARITPPAHVAELYNDLIVIPCGSFGAARPIRCTPRLAHPRSCSFFYPPPSVGGRRTQQAGVQRVPGCHAESWSRDGGERFDATRARARGCATEKREGAAGESDACGTDRISKLAARSRDESERRALSDACSAQKRRNAFRDDEITAAGPVEADAPRAYLASAPKARAAWWSPG